MDILEFLKMNKLLQVMFKITFDSPFNFKMAHYSHSLNILESGNEKNDDFDIKTENSKFF